jgi:hypothetical protein
MTAIRANQLATEGDPKLWLEWVADCQHLGPPTANRNGVSQGLKQERFKMCAPSGPTRKRPNESDATIFCGSRCDALSNKEPPLFGGPVGGGPYTGRLQDFEALKKFRLEVPHLAGCPT